MPFLLSSRLRLLSAALCATLAASSAHALEHITLRNGFSYDCSHHEQVGDRIRLYFGAANNYQDFPADNIKSVELLPDPPAPPTPQPPAAQPPTTNIQSLLSSVGNAINIDVDLLASIVHAESNFHPRAVSRAGAQGLMQLMPATAHQIGVTDAFRPEQNIAAGTVYLNELLNRYDPHDTPRGLALAIAAYNAGPGAVDKYHGIPPFRETRAYVARVINEFNRRKAAAAKTAHLAATRTGTTTIAHR
ncbi:MAG: lytic transglycosylase domain-containing protein [Acidobacteriota bacterium]